MGQWSTILVLLIAGVSAISAAAAQTTSTRSKPSEPTYTIVKFKVVPASATYPGGARIEIKTSRNAEIVAVCKDTPDQKPSDHETPAHEDPAQLFGAGPTGNHCSVLKNHVGEPFVVMVGARASDFAQWFSEKMKDRTDAALAAFRAGQYPQPPKMAGYREGKDLTILDPDDMVILEIASGDSSAK